VRCQLETLRCFILSRNRHLNIVLCLFFAVQFVHPLLHGRIPICQLQR
jgi:hypothetical protein